MMLELETDRETEESLERALNALQVPSLRD
jgi:hypothetical protein